MSKNMLSLPGGMIKNGGVGALISLVCYILLQALSALLVCEEIISPDMVYPAVCVSAAVASFVGCVVGMVQADKGNALSSAVVVAVFLSLTVLIGVCMNEGGVDGSGLIGVGVAMSLGGLASAFLGGGVRRKEGGYDRSRNRRRRK